MDKPKVRTNINHIIEIIDAFSSGKNTITKMGNDSSYLEHKYTSESILANIKVSAQDALKGLDDYE